MAQQRSTRATRAQVQAYRFGVRRLERALSLGRSHETTLHEPRYGLSMLIGILFTAILLAGFGVFGLLEPSPKVGDANVLIDTDTGGAYAVIDGVAHPATNLASAMLAVAGSKKLEVKKVSDQTLATIPRGQLVGLDNAPNTVPTAKTLSQNTWNVCDTTTAADGSAGGPQYKVRTTAVIGRPTVAGMAQDQAVLVTPDSKSYFLLWNGHRSRITDIGDATVQEALGLSRDQARPISLGLLNAIPAAEPVGHVSVPKRGRPRQVGTATMHIGDIGEVTRSDGSKQLYLILPDGWQAVNPVAADMVRYSWSSRPAPVPVIPSNIAALPESSHPMDFAAVPDRKPNLVPADTHRVLCTGWSPDGQTVSVQDDLPLPPGARPVTAPPAGVNARTSAKVVARQADEIYVEPGGGLLAARRLGDGSSSSGDLFLISDQGVAFPLAQPELAELWKLSGHSVAVPGTLLDLIPIGVSLDPKLARRVHN